MAIEIVTKIVHIHPMTAKIKPPIFPHIAPLYNPIPLVDNNAVIIPLIEKSNRENGDLSTMRLRKKATGKVTEPKIKKTPTI